MCRRSQPASAPNMESTVAPALDAQKLETGETGIEERDSSGDMGVTGSDCGSEFSRKSRSAESATALPLQKWITSSHFAGSMTLCDSTETTFKGCANRVTAERQLQKMAASAGEDR